MFTERERYQRYERYQRALRTSQTRTSHDIAHHREARGRRRRRPGLRHAPAARRRSRHRARFTHRARPSRSRRTRHHRAFDSPVVTISTTHSECIPTSTILSDPFFIIISYFERCRNESKTNLSQSIKK